MDQRTQKQVARRRAREVRSEWEQRRQDREKRIEDDAVVVMVALDTIAQNERQAGAALSRMVENEGLTLREAVGWCGSTLTVRAAARLRGLDSAHDGSTASTASTGPTAGDDDGGATR